MSNPQPPPGNALSALSAHNPMSDMDVDRALAQARRDLILQRAIGAILLGVLFAGLVYYGRHGADDTLARLNQQGADLLAMLLVFGLMYGLPILGVAIIYTVVTSKPIGLLVLEVRDARGFAPAGPAVMARVRELAQTYPPINEAMARWCQQRLRVRDAALVFDAASELARRPGNAEQLG